MAMNTRSAVDRLNRQLPLKARQDRLSPALKQLHQAILWSLARQGRPPGDADMADIVGAGNLSAALQGLAQQDLVVLDKHGTVLGAYPLTTEVTPHRLTLHAHHIHAMCALDALSVGPLFTCEVRIESRCHVTGDAIHIDMQQQNLSSVKPPAPMVGIRWQMPTGAAAHSMCIEMVFLRDRQTARHWHGDAQESISLFSLVEAIDFGAAFFMPLLNHA